MGHEDAFPRPRLSARCRFSQGTFAGSQGNRQSACSTGRAYDSPDKAHRGANSLRSACCGWATAIGFGGAIVPDPAVDNDPEKVGIHRWSWQLLKLPKATTKRRVRYRLMNDTAPISA
jgi:hypothetical protein